MASKATVIWPDWSVGGTWALSLLDGAQTGNVGIVGAGTSKAALGLGVTTSTIEVA